MIKAAGAFLGRPLLMLGLSRTNVDRLCDNQPINVSDTAVLGLPRMQVWMLGGADHAEIIEDLRAMGAPTETLPPDVADRAVITASAMGRPKAGGPPVPLLLVGIPRATADRMLAGEKVRLTTDDLAGLPPMVVILLAGETEDAIRATIAAGNRP